MYCALELAIPHKETYQGEPLSRQKLVASTIPWHGAAAGLTHELHAEIRRMEVHLVDMVTGVRGVRRGGSNLNTQYALKAVVNLSQAPAVDDQTILAVLNYLDGWVRRADAVFRPEQGLHRLPREPKEKEWRCPYCEYQTMRWHPPTGIVVCINPDCHTEESKRPRWSAAFTINEDILRFTWEAA